MQTVAYSTLIQAAELPKASARFQVPVPFEPGGGGDWHYHGIPRGSRIPWFGLMVSAGLHLFVLFGFNHHVKPVKKHVQPDTNVIQMAMPDLKEIEEPPPTELQDDPTKATAVDVPTLVDVPSFVDVYMGFVQPLDTRPPLEANLSSSRVQIVPVNIAHGPHAAGALKDIFDLSQLDRIPQAVSQVSPRFPPELKRDFSYAEVVVEFIVDTEGAVQFPTVVKSTYGGFDRAAVEGVSKWRFRPGLRMGHRVNTRMRVPIRFKVSDTDDSP